MKNIALLLLALVFVLGMAGNADATLVLVRGQMTFEVGGTAWDPFVADLNGGNAFTIDVAPDGSFSLPASIYDATSSLHYPISGVHAGGGTNYGTATIVAHNATGSFAFGNNPVTTCPGGGNLVVCVDGGGFGGTMPITGKAFLHSTSGGSVTAIPLSMFGHYLPPPVVAGNMTGYGTAWTTQRAEVHTGINPLTITGQFWDNGLDPGSTITLVSVSHVLEYGFIDVPIGGTVTISIVPEPGSALLLGSGLLGLVALARRKAE